MVDNTQRSPDTVYGGSDVSRLVPPVLTMVRLLIYCLVPGLWKDVQRKQALSVMHLLVYDGNTLESIQSRVIYRLVSLVLVGSHGLPHVITPASFPQVGSRTIWKHYKALCCIMSLLKAQSNIL